MTTEHENGEPAPEITQLRAEVARLNKEATKTGDRERVLTDLWIANMRCVQCPAVSFCHANGDQFCTCKEGIENYGNHVIRQTKLSEVEP